MSRVCWCVGTGAVFHIPIANSRECPRSYNAATSYIRTAAAASDRRFLNISLQGRQGNDYSQASAV